MSNVIPIRPADSWPWKDKPKVWLVRWVAVDGHRHVNRVKATSRTLAELAVGSHQEFFYDFVGEATEEMSIDVPKDSLDTAIRALMTEIKNCRDKAWRGSFWREKAEALEAAFDDLIRASAGEL